MVVGFISSLHNLVQGGLRSGLMISLHFITNTHFSSAKKFYIQESKLGVKLKSFSAVGARLRMIMLMLVL